MSQFMVVVTGNYTGLEFTFGPYTEGEAKEVIKRMKEGQTQHTTKSLRKV